MWRGSFLGPDVKPYRFEALARRRNCIIICKLLAVLLERASLHAACMRPKEEENVRLSESHDG